MRICPTYVVAQDASIFEAVHGSAPDIAGLWTMNLIQTAAITHAGRHRQGIG